MNVVNVMRMIDINTGNYQSIYNTNSCNEKYESIEGHLRKSLRTVLEGEYSIVDENA